MAMCMPIQGMEQARNTISQCPIHQLILLHSYACTTGNAAVFPIDQIYTHASNEAAAKGHTAEALWYALKAEKLPHQTCNSLYKKSNSFRKKLYLEHVCKTALLAATAYILYRCTNRYLIPHSQKITTFISEPLKRYFCKTPRICGMYTNLSKFFYTKYTLAAFVSLQRAYSLSHDLRILTYTGEYSRRDTLEINKALSKAAGRSFTL